MLSLVVVACLATDPKSCETLEIGRSTTEGFKACSLSMRSRVEQWAIAHPDRTVKSAFCMTGRSPVQP